MIDTIKTWKERKGLLNSEPFRAYIGVEWEMQAEIDELRATLAQQAEQVHTNVKSSAGLIRNGKVDDFMESYFPAAPKEDV